MTLEIILIAVASVLALLTILGFVFAIVYFVKFRKSKVMELPNGFKIVNDTSEILRFREDIKKTKSKLDKHYGRRKDDTYKERDPNEVKASQITSISYCDYPYHLYDHHYCYSHHSHNHSYYVEQPKKYAIEYGDCERY